MVEFLYMVFAVLAYAAFAVGIVALSIVEARREAVPSHSVQGERHEH